MINTLITDTLISKLHHLLIQQNKMLTTSESCTGGMISSAITSKSGSSQWFDRGFVTYSNAAKKEQLSVKQSTLDKFGAVSEEVAKEMAEGCLRHSQSQYGLSVTGIAGPSGGTTEKPVGTVWFAWSYYDAAQKIQSKSSIQQLTGDRQDVRYQSCIFSIQELIQIIKAQGK